MVLNGAAQRAQQIGFDRLTGGVDGADQSVRIGATMPDEHKPVEFVDGQLQKLLRRIAFDSNHLPLTGEDSRMGRPVTISTQFGTLSVELRTPSSTRRQHVHVGTSRNILGTLCR